MRSDRRPWPLVALLAALLALAAAGPASARRADGHRPPEQNAPLPNPTGCDDLDPYACLLPFPNDLYTRPDPTTATGRRVALDVRAMPRNVAGRPIDPSDHNRADGFSPGSPIIARVPGLDTDQALDASRVPRIYDPELSLRRSSPVQVIDAATGRRQMVWAELDHSMDGAGATGADRVLIVRPARNLLEGHRYVVALRDLRGADGMPLSPGATFAAYRDGRPLPSRFDEQRRAHFEDLFATLARAGVPRRSLVLAWDFTVASEASLAGRMLHIRDDAFRQLGDRDLADLRVAGRAPAFTLSRVEDLGCPQRHSAGLEANLVLVDATCPGGASRDGKIAYDVKGTMTVPCYLSTPGCAPAHSTFVLDPASGLPRQLPGNVMKVDFRCRIPRVALEHPGESRPALYGHGLFGSYNEIGQGQLADFMSEDDLTFCATAWAGMATEDVPNVATILADVSNFNTLADRVQQGMLNFLYLGRLMIHPDGLCSQAAFRVGGRCILDTRRLFYDGNSQGGIIGGALTAVAPDFTRATLGVLGMNYSTLLTRSTDFGTGTRDPSPTPGNPTNGLEYAYPLYKAYPQRNERQLVFALIQMLWDRAEPDGYAQHMTSDPLPDTPRHQVMLMAAYGDHQVANVAAEVEARTVGARILKPDMLRPNRPWELRPWVGLRPIRSFPARDVSVFTIWDGGSRPVPLSNTPQDRAKDDDPHEWVRNTRAARDMKSAFLSLDSRVLDTCTHAADGRSVPYCDTDPRSDDLDKDPLAGIR